METFKLLLQELDTTLRQYNMPAYENLLPPLPDKEIDKNLQELGIDDEDMKTLFQWKSGMKDENGSLMMHAGGLLTFDTIKESVSFNDFYDPLLIPLISDNGEEMLLFNNKRGAHYGKLHFYSVSSLYIQHPVSFYDSLYAMIKTTIAAYKEQAYEYIKLPEYQHDKERWWLDIDHYKLDEIAKRYNKHCIYWTNHNPLKSEEWYEI